MGDGGSMFEGKSDSYVPSGAWSVVKTFGIVSLVFLAAVGICCSKSEGGECFEGPAGFSDAPLPIAHTNVQVDCVDVAVPPSVEVWAGAADSVLVGTVVRVCPHMEPAVVTVSGADPPYVSESDCTGFIEGGAVVTLVDVETLYGSDLGLEVTVTLGANVVQEYFPILMVLSDRKMQWVPPGREGKITPGQRIGGAMFVDPDWGFIGPQKHGVFFKIDGDGNVRFQEYDNEHCYAPVPTGVDGIPLDDLRNILSSLDLSDPDVQQEIESRKHWYNEPLGRLDFYWGTKCFPADECSADSDCDAGEICRDGFCGPECVVDADCGPGELCVNGQCEAV
jgi:hypothetical protein